MVLAIATFFLRDYLAASVLAFPAPQKWHADLSLTSSNVIARTIASTGRGVWAVRAFRAAKRLVLHAQPILANEKTQQSWNTMIAVLARVY